MNIKVLLPPWKFYDYRIKLHRTAYPYVLFKMIISESNLALNIHT